jgi:hypothetical protein
MTQRGIVLQAWCGRIMNSRKYRRVFMGLEKGPSGSMRSASQRTIGSSAGVLTPSSELGVPSEGNLNTHVG